MRTALFGTLFYALPLIFAVGVAIPNLPDEPILVAEGRLLPEDDELDLVDIEVTDPDADPEAEEMVPTEPAPARPATPETPATEGEGGAAPASAGETSDADGEGTVATRSDVLAKPGPANKGKSKRDCTKPHPNVRSSPDGIVEVDRSLVDHYTKNLQTFMTLGNSRPYDENGIKGWYISGFTCESPVHKAGFRRGDVLLTVNGKNTRSWVGVFLLYQKLKHQSDFEVEVVRKGVATRLRFKVIDG